MFRLLLSWAAVPILALGLTCTLAWPALAQERREQGNLVIEGVPEIPQALADRMLQYLNTRSAKAWDWDPSGSGLFLFTRLGETTQVHRVASPGGYREQLTFFSEPVSNATVNPDPARQSFLFTKDLGGNEAYQIYHFDLATGRFRMLTDGKSRHGSMVWNHKGDRFAYHGTQRNGTDWDLYVADPKSPGPGQMVLSQGGSWSLLDWSPDDKSLLVTRRISINRSSLHILDLKTGKLQDLRPSSQEIAYGSACFTGDGKGIWFTSDEASEFHLLRHLDLGSGRMETLTGGIPWDVEELELSRDGRTLAFTTNEDGISRLYTLDARTRKGGIRRLEGLPSGHISGIRFDAEGRRLAVSVNGSGTPGDVFVFDLEKGTPVRWTFSEVGGLDPSAFVEPTLVRYPTFDQADGQPRQIPAFFYRPEGEGPFPVLINIHGGPESQARPKFSSFTQYLVKEMGIAVLAPNVRGSSGYGKTWLQLDNGFLREDSVKDIGALLDWIARQKDLDAGRVAVMGGSYGGYMTLSSMTHYNERLRAGVDVVGISNFVTFLQNTQDYRRDRRRVEYGDERDPKMRAFLESIAPTNNAHKITRPLFVVQGQNDPRVPVTEAEQMVEVVRSNGGAVWYLMAKDEGHGFAKKSNRDFYLQSVVLFLQKFLVER
ncbi:MAG: S9 family peptidase [Candidatus Xenobium sp.]|jgi:dipeptidyl aminopeptidase/acylaminoacyl peptidase